MKTVSQRWSAPIYAQILTDSAEEGKEGDSYYNMMKYNLDKIVISNKNPFKSKHSHPELALFTPVKSLENLRTW